MGTLIVMESDQSPGQWILINIFHFYCCIQVNPLCRDLHKGHHHQNQCDQKFSHIIFFWIFSLQI